MDMISGLVSQVTGGGGGSGGGGLSQFGDLAKYASLLQGGGSSGAASSASISSILGMLNSGPTQSHSSSMPSGLQGLFSQLVGIKQG